MKKIYVVRERASSVKGFSILTRPVVAYPTRKQALLYIDKMTKYSNVLGEALSIEEVEFSNALLVE